MQGLKIKKRQHELIERLTVLYLALPLALFFLLWLKPVFAIVSFLVLAVSVFLYFRATQQDYLTLKPKFVTTGRTVVIAGLVITLWVALSGVGGLGNQNNDYHKHNAIIADLTEKSPPVTYNMDGMDRPLVYYIGYYLPATATGKVFSSVQLSQALLLLWTVLGIMLVVYWAARLVGTLRMSLVFLFIFFAGLDVLGFIVAGNIANPYGGVVEWYAGPGNLHYGSFTTYLYWGPQFAVSGCLFAALLATLFVEGRGKRSVVFLASLSMMWSPFITFGLLPIGLAFITAKKKIFEHARELLSFQNVVGGLWIAGVTLLFLAANNQPQTLELFYQYSRVPGMEFLTKVFYLFVFLLLELWFYLAVMWPYIRTMLARNFKVLLWWSVAFLTVLPLLRYGFVNDIVIKPSIPALFVLFIVVYKFLIEKRMQFSKRWIVMLVALGIAALVPLLEMRTHTSLNGKHVADSWQSLGNPNLPEEERFLAEQYYGDKTSLFYRYLAR